MLASSDKAPSLVAGFMCVSLLKKRSKSVSDLMFKLNCIFQKFGRGKNKDMDVCT